MGVVARCLTGLALIALAGCGGEAEGEAVLEGRWIGDKVSFVVEGGAAKEVRFIGIECRVPHPDNEVLSVCLVRAPGLPQGQLGVGGGGISGELDGVTVTGSFTGQDASGTWHFEAECPDGSICVADGEWSAVYFYEEPEPEPDADSDVPGLPDAGPDTPIGPGPIDDVPVVVPPNASQLQAEAADLLTQLRATVGVGPAVQEELINKAAQAHADYYALHYDKYQSSNLSAHNENPDWSEGFTGEGPGQRLAHQGVDGAMGASEVMAFSGSPQGAIDGWMATLYHRIPLIHPNSTRWGFGIGTQGVKVEVGNLLFGDATKPGPARWPLPGSEDVSPSWHGYESPQPPLPAGQSYPSGPVITVTFTRGQGPKLTSAVLTGPSGEVEAQVQHPGNDSWLSDTWALYAYSPLEPQTTYTVTFTGTVGGAPVEESWSFTTDEGGNNWWD